MDSKDKFLFALMLATIVPRLSADELSTDRIQICIEKTKKLSVDCKKALTDLFKHARKRSAHYTSQINPAVATGAASAVVVAGLAYRVFKDRFDQRSPNTGPLLSAQREYPLEDGTVKMGEFPYPDGMPRQDDLAVDYKAYEQSIALAQEEVRGLKRSGTKTQQQRPGLQDIFIPPTETANRTSEDNPGDLPTIEEDDVTHLKEATTGFFDTIKRTLSRATSFFLPVGSPQT
jgi:hypothetical protein